MRDPPVPDFDFNPIIFEPSAPATEHQSHPLKAKT